MYKSTDIGTYQELNKWCPSARLLRPPAAVAALWLQTLTKYLDPICPLCARPRPGLKQFVPASTSDDLQDLREHYQPWLGAEKERSAAYRKRFAIDSFIVIKNA